MSIGPVDLLIFDLDGTLIDSKLDLARSVNAARGHMGLAPLENERVYSYVGNGAPVLIRRALGADASEDDVNRALAFFLSYYRDHMLEATTLYPGVQEALDRLAGAGVGMAVLTNKPVRFSQGIIAGLGLESYFFRVYGGNSFEQKKPDPVGVDTLLGETHVPRARAMMVGDSGVDIRTARSAGIMACGVSWGFQPETFEEDPPDLLIDDLRDLAGLVLRANAG